MNQTKSKLLEEHYLDLETYGRKTGKPHTVELSFYSRDKKIYLLAHKRDKDLGTDWYFNLKANPDCEIEIKDQKFKCRASSLEENTETEDFIRESFIKKFGQEYYKSWYERTKRIPVVLEVLE